MESIGTRVRERAAALGIPSQQELARRVGMAPDALSRALNGGRGFAITELISIADALGVALHWLATGLEDPHQLSVAARHGYDHATKERQVVDWSTSRAVLENIALAYTQVDDRLPVRIGPAVPTAARQARDALLQAGGVGFVRQLADVIEAAFPVDVVRATEVDGGFTVGIGRRVVLAVSDTSNWFHQNFSLAHELGHVAARSMGSIDAPVSDVDHVERQANAFAAELLLPADEMRMRDWSRMTPSEVADFLWESGVSTKALASRLDGLRLEAGQLGWRLRDQSTQKFLRQHLVTPEGDANLLVSRRMQEAAARRFPIGLLTAHRDAIEDGALHAKTLAWMLDDDAEAIEAELRPRDESDSVDDLAEFLGLGE
jgi:Zn-dependent peptidase ImmA (M78 family)/transcriptional regulator with XRE-family HTH domain